MQKIRIDFDNPGLPQHISAVENDSQSRFFQATLYENGKSYTAPEGATYSIMYRGFGPQNQGWYDTINDGAGKRAACSVSGNVVTCEIARQALQVPGHVSIVLCVTTGKGYMLKSWPIECDCKNDRYDSTAEIQSFFYITQVSNADWTQAIQAVEELKNIIDPTLSLSGKAADAKATGDALKEEAERAKGVESGLKEDLVDLTQVKLTWIDGQYVSINTTSGSFFDSANWKRTDRIPVIPNTEITFYTCMSESAGGYFYDANGTAVCKVLSTNDQVKLTTYTVTVPDGAFYFVFSWNKKLSDDSHNYIIVKNLIKSVREVSKMTNMNSSQIEKIDRKTVFATFKEMLDSKFVGIGRVGGTLFRNVVANPFIKMNREDAYNFNYFDINSSIKQYRTINKQNVVVHGFSMNNIGGDEIDFTPSEVGFTRIIVGKDSDDTFFVSYVPSKKDGSNSGSLIYSILEKTKDFVTFEPVWKDYRNSKVKALKIPNIGAIDVKIVKQFSNGNYIIGAKCYRVDLVETTTNFFIMNKNMTNIALIQYTDPDGNVVDMKDPNAGDIYDWHVDVKGSSCIVSTYGTGKPETCLGDVWYTEDSGRNWKKVFRMTNHYQDGVEDGVIITQTHVHGVMIDPYDNRIFVFAGEDNRNIFWSDKGISTTDDDWNVIPIREKKIYPFQAFTQVVNGFAFRDCIVFGSDNPNIGVVFRINKLDDGSYSDIEAAYEFHPNAFSGNTYYCGAEMYRRDMRTPLLFCATRENCMTTETENEQLNYKHRARVLATYDGINFKEVWKDSTYGLHDTTIDGTKVQRNYAYCTRGMNCYLLNNGDAVIKYSGRDWYLFGGKPILSVVGYSNGSCKVRIIKNAERYL